MNGIREIELKDNTWSDTRGWGVNPIDIVGLSNKPIGRLHMVSLTPGSVRGNHSHKGSTEWLLVSGGPAKIAWRRLDQKSIEMILVKQDEPALFEILSLTEHAIMNTGQKDIFLLAFCDQEDRETFPCPSLFSPDNSKSSIKNPE